MAPRSKRARATAGAAIIVAAVALAAAALAASQLKSSEDRNDEVLIGEARSGAVRVELGSAVGEVKLRKPHRPGGRSSSSMPATAGGTRVPRAFRDRRVKRS